MKKITLLIILISNHFFAQELQNPWVWIGGNKNEDENTLVYGSTSEENSLNFPYLEKSGKTLKDSEGNFWFFGSANTGSDKVTSALWMYNPVTNNFTYKNGVFRGNSRGTNKGVNVESYNNLLHSVANRQMWIDSNDNIWCYSGYYWGGSGANKTELWKYKKATNNWVLINEGAINDAGNYGTLGVEDSTNRPPVIENAITWTDNQNNLWLFGGHLLNTFDGKLNALWKYNIISGNWTWMSGSSSINQPSQYGTLGLEASNSLPGSSDSGCGSWTDNLNNLWLFDNSNIWKYNTITNLCAIIKRNPNTSGLESIVTIGTENNNNFPIWGSGTHKGKAIWKDLSGNIWYYYNWNNNDRLWKYNPLTNMWTLVKTIPNSTTTGHAIGALNIADINNTLGSRINTITETASNGKLLLMGGNFYTETGNLLSDVWEYDITTNIWKWIKGFAYNDTSIDNQQKIKFKGVIESENSPGFMEKYTAKWEYNGDLYLYGIIGLANYTSVPSYHSVNTHFLLSNGVLFSRGIWKYHSNLNKWEYIQGLEDRDFNFHLNPIHNTKGIESENNYPSVRYGSVSWADTNGNLWMFGGKNTYSVNTYYNDLWKFNITTKNWVWVNGDSVPSQNGVYGTQGIISTTNKPGSRTDSKTWVDNLGNFWLFGGIGFDASSSSTGNLNDMWKYDISLNQWVWVKGSNMMNQPEISAGLGISNTTNTPSFSASSCSWTDSSNNFWLYSYGAMWKFNTSTNNWVKLTNQSTLNYGIVGITNITNNPGILYGGATWVDTDGNLLHYNVSFWKFNVSSNLWTWIGGKKTNTFDTSYKYGNYGVFNIPSTTNIPGLRTNTASWKDNTGNLYLYGGSGWDEDSEGKMSDVWKTDGNMTLGINENSFKAKFMAYPNPVKDNVFFKTTENINKIEVYDLTGRIIISKYNIENKLNLSELKTGNYLLRVYSENEITTIKIIKE